MADELSDRISVFLAEVRKGLEGVTEGPWESVVDDHGHDRVDASVWADSIGYYVIEKVTSGERHIADAEFVAAAREWVPRLLSAVENAHRMVGDLEGLASLVNSVDLSAASVALRMALQGGLSLIRPEYVPLAESISRTAAAQVAAEDNPPPPPHEPHDRRTSDEPASRE